MDPISELQFTAQISVPCNLYGLVRDTVGSFSLGAPFVGAVVLPFGLLPSLCVSGPSTLRLSFFGSRTPCAAPRPLPPPSEVRVRSGAVEGALRMYSRWVSPPRSRRSVGEERGWHCGGLGFCGCERFDCFLPPRG